MLVRMPRTLHRDLVGLAEAEGVSLNQFLVSVLARAAAQAYGEAGGSADGALADAVYRLVDVVRDTRDQVEETAEKVAGLAERADDLEESWVIATRGYVDRIEATVNSALDPGRADRKQLHEEGVKQRITSRVEGRRQADGAQDA